MENKSGKKRIIAIVLISIFLLAYFLSGFIMSFKVIDTNVALENPPSLMASAATSGSCQMKGCSNPATVRLSANVYNEKVAEAVRACMNNAGFSLSSGSFVAKETETAEFVDNYYTFTFQDDGSVQMRPHSDTYEYTYQTGSHTVDYLRVEGRYCTEHANLAAKTLHNDYEKELTRGFVYLWGEKLFPYNMFAMLLIILVAAVVVVRMKSARQNKEKEALIEDQQTDRETLERLLRQSENQLKSITDDQNEKSYQPMVFGISGAIFAGIGLLIGMGTFKWPLLGLGGLFALIALVTLFGNMSRKREMNRLKKTIESLKEKL